MKRHQNHSCAQCKKSKKACDGYLLNSTVPLGSTAFESTLLNCGASLDTRLLPCSYCSRTKKSCSLNVQWGRRQALSPTGDSTGDMSFQTKRQRTDHYTMADALPPNLFVVDANGPSDLLQPPSWNDGSHDWVTPLLNLEASTAPLGSHNLDSLLCQENNSSVLEIHQSLHDNLMLKAPPSVSADHILQVDLSNLLGQATDDNSQLAEPVAQQATWGSLQPYREQRGSSSSAASLLVGRPGSRKRHEGEDESTAYSDGFSTGLSPFSAPHTIMSGSNKSLITESLLKIYHDVLENNLGCWLAEDTCPYRMQQRRRDFSSPQLVIGAEGAQVSQEWGAMWSNRMYRRVKQLDRIAQTSCLVRLTRAESKATAKALDLAIMAFATQWSQGRRRRQSIPGRNMFEENFNLSEDDEDDGFGDDFEQTLQMSMYEQARKALRDVSDLESFRVVYAELIFGMMQKPWASPDSSRDETSGASLGDIFDGLKPSILPRIVEIMSQDGPPVYIERAIRKIHTLKFRFEAMEAGYQTTRDINAPQHLSTVDRGTIGLLYWLAVMFDTVSASMNERPVALADEDCLHDDHVQTSAKRSATDAQDAVASRRWVLDLYAQDDPEKPWPLHWPCSYDITTRAVARSAVVKVLLFRYVSYFQNALRKNERGEAIEEIIQSTIAVYRYWNVTHGAFFRDLIKHFDSVPTRIRSWFPCIAIPWHLGALIFADLLDHVDNNGLGTQEASTARLAATMASRIRRSSAIELSDLAKATTPQTADDMPVEQLQDFHFAVNEGALLTEPWTVLLIRAFTKAALFHLGVVEDLRENDWGGLGVSLERGECCVNALWFLGRKSEMARDLARVLGQALRGQ